MKVQNFVTCYTDSLYKGVILYSFNFVTSPDVLLLVTMFDWQVMWVQPNIEHMENISRIYITMWNIAINIKNHSMKLHVYLFIPNFFKFSKNEEKIILKKCRLTKTRIDQ